MKMNFEAIANRVSPDEVIKLIIDELGNAHKLPFADKPSDKTFDVDSRSGDELAPAEAFNSSDASDAVSDDGKTETKKAKRRFSKK